MKPMTVWATVGVIISITTLTHVTHARQAFKGDPGELGDPGFDLSRPTHGLNTSKDELHDHCIAESYGRDIGHCDLAYSSCPFNLGQLLTTGLSLLEGSLSGFPQA
ncbi:hypothetical protein Hamer_G021643 [Homarus americanus]|uniref:Uncharacterized protein n=1 Tax=Homarus americanus TaxID=6706 RepID=A0A8J5MR32_HOMAM|nr:hypothetical protein Hamer_G021643 [Homarus americanus]